MSDHKNNHELPFDIPVIINSDIDSLTDRTFTAMDIQALKLQNPVLLRILNKKIEHICPQDLPAKSEILQLVTDVLRLCGSAATRITLEDDLQISNSEAATTDQNPPMNY